jgi:hypothetical protein
MFKNTSYGFSSPWKKEILTKKPFKPENDICEYNFQNIRTRTPNVQFRKITGTKAIN